VYPRNLGSLYTYSRYINCRIQSPQYLLFDNSTNEGVVLTTPWLMAKFPRKATALWLATCLRDLESRHAFNIIKATCRGRYDGKRSGLVTVTYKASDDKLFRIS